MTNKTFKELKVGLISKRLEKMKNLGQEMERFWTHITSEVFDFEQGTFTTIQILPSYVTYTLTSSPFTLTSLTNGMSTAYRDVENIEPLTRNDILEFLNQNIHPSSSTRVKLSIYLITQASTRVSAAAENSTPAKENNTSAMHAEKDVIAVNGNKPAVSSINIPAKVKDVKAWKASLHLSAAAAPVKALSGFKERKGRL